MCKHVHPDLTEKAEVSTGVGSAVGAGVGDNVGDCNKKYSQSLAQK
jgi:hypothetical protein